MINENGIKKYFNKKLFSVLFIIMSVCVCTNSVKSMAQPSPELFFRPAPNPAAAYCEDLGYEYSIKSTKEGDYGMCLLPDGSEVEEWKFLEGKAGEEYSYCQQKGYSIKTISGEKCNYSAECAVCVLDDNTEVEVTQLVKQEKELEKSQLKDDSMEREAKKFDIKIIIATIVIAIIIVIMTAAYYFLVRNGNKKNEL